MDRVIVPENISVIYSNESLNAAVNKARKVMLSGGVVAFPTESFYGLAVDIRKDKAIEKLFYLKGRNKNNPILLLLPRAEDLKKYVKDIPGSAVRLMDEFWPGGLTMLFEAAQNISPLLTAGTGKIGFRYSSHPVATALAGSIDCPVTGTSANLSGHPPCTRAGQVYDYFGTDIDLILDNGPAPGGKGSTVLDVTVDPFVVLRDGMVEKNRIDKALVR